MVSAPDIRRLAPLDADAVLALYRAASAPPGSGLSRRPPEYDLAAVQARIPDPDFLCLGAFRAGSLVGELHCRRMTPAQFRGVWTDLTVATAPQAQGQGVGTALFQALFLEAARQGVRRIELMTRSGNLPARRLYARLGFVEEGRLVGRVRLADGAVEDDIPMAWSAGAPPAGTGAA